MKRWGLAALAVAAYFAAVLLWLGHDPRVGEEVFAPGSVWSTAPEGASLAFEYLKERGRRVAVLDRRIEARELESEGVVFQVVAGWEEEAEEEGEEEEEEEKEEEAEGEEEEEQGAEVGRLVTAREEPWVMGGGRLIVAIGFGFGELVVEELEPAEVPGPVKVFPVWPGARELAPPEARVLGGTALAGSHSVWLLSGRPLLTRWQMGRGEVILLSCPEIFYNQHLGTADHLALLEALAPPGRAIYFDETLHGADASPGLFYLLGHYRLGPALSLGLLAFGCFFWRSALRLGPAEEEHRERRTEAVDLVDSLARLYARALRPSEAIELYRQALREAVAHHTGLSGAALEDRLTRLSGKVEPAELERAISRLNEAFRRLADEKRPRNR